MINRKELKDLAKKQIQGNVGMFFVCYFLISIMIGAGASVIFGAFLLTPPFTLALVIISQNLVKGEKPKIENIFDGFKENGFERSLILYLLVYVYTLLWSLVFIIPGIIKGLSYSMSFYILQDNPDMTPTEAIEERKRITYGHKWEIFVLYLSFIGWYLLVPFTFGAILIYLIPYVQMTNVNYYNKLKEIQKKEEPKKKTKKVEKEEK